jgi:2-polyprenyl-3-methyl-5-hydroxy-6-metoxy-1,4-benzoquinol methylase
MKDQFDDYHIIKGWNKDNFAMSSNLSLLDSYAALIRMYIPGSVEAALDFGFGNGEMLQTFKILEVNDICGVEANASLVKRANQMGFNAFNSVVDINTSLEGALDVITAMHVLEHIDYREIEVLLGSFGKLLKPGGYLIASFPNGESPFSSYAFHSDPTHITILSREKCRILAIKTALELVHYNAFPAIGRHSNKFHTRFLSRLRETGESFIYFLLNKFIFGSEKVLMSPVAVAVWKKRI